MADHGLDPPIFVVGYMHSGTSFLKRILWNHPEVYSGRTETKFFERLGAVARRFPALGEPDAKGRAVALCADAFEKGLTAALERRLGTLSEEEVERIAEKLDPAVGHAGVFAAVADHLALRAGRRRWLEKTPSHVYCAPEIARSLPRALFVEIVRDPRDVLASKKTRKDVAGSRPGMPASTRERKRLEKAFHPLWDSLSWRSAIEAGEAMHREFPERILTIRYEDLVERHREVVESLCAFTGLDFAERMIQVSFSNAADRRTRRPGGGSGPVTGSVQRWRSTLTRGELTVCQWATSKAMARLGYGIEPVDPAGAAAGLRWMSAAPFELVRRSVSRARLGGAALLASAVSGYARRLGILARRSDPR